VVLIMFIGISTLRASQKRRRRKTGGACPDPGQTPFKIGRQVISTVLFRPVEHVEKGSIRCAEVTKQKGRISKRVGQKPKTPDNFRTAMRP